MVKRAPLPKKEAKTPAAIENIEKATRSNRGLSKLIIDCVEAIEKANLKIKNIRDGEIKPALNLLKQNGYSKVAANWWVAKRKMEKQERIAHFEDIKIIGDGLGEQLDIFGVHPSEIPEAELDAKSDTMQKVREAAAADQVAPQPEIKATLRPDPSTVAESRARVASIIPPISERNFN